jgi:molybdopterin-guanine dinucleotide biosynthesis protein A
MMTRTPVAAAILAGGSARRLGGATKSTLRVGGLRIIDRQIEALSRVADPILVIASDPAPYRDLRVEIVADVLPGHGALGGIYTAIVKSPCERTLVVAGDLPFLAVPLLQRLTADSEADVVIPRGRRGYEPLCAVYSRRCEAAIRRRLSAGLLRASDLPEGARVEELGPDVLAAYDPDGLLFVNVNTPHDYERAEGLFESMAQRPEDRITDKLPSS